MFMALGCAICYNGTSEITMPLRCATTFGAMLDTLEVPSMSQHTPRPFTAQDDAFIRQNYLLLTGQQLADALGRPLQTVYYRKHKLGCVVTGKRREQRSCKQCGVSFAVVASSPRKYCTVECAYASKD